MNALKVSGFAITMPTFASKLASAAYLIATMIDEKILVTRSHVLFASSRVGRRRAIDLPHLRTWPQST